MSPSEPTRFRLGRAMRLRGVGAFGRVYDGRASARIGALTVFARPNDLGHPRLGLSVPRAAGGAVARNRVKRRLREAFRLAQHELPAAYDVVINVRRHDPLPVEAYRRQLADAIGSLHRRWIRRAEQSEGDPAPRPPRG